MKVFWEQGVGKLFESTTAQVAEEWRELQKEEIHVLRFLPRIVPIGLRNERMKRVYPKAEGREKLKGKCSEVQRSEVKWSEGNEVKWNVCIIIYLKLCSCK